MSTALITHPACVAHDTPLGHPESADRLRAVLHALEDEAFLYLLREEAPRATREALERAHTPAHIDAVQAREPGHHGAFAHFDPDTVMALGSYEAAERAAGAVVAAVDGVAGGHFRNAFCAVRPPGHHAEPERAMGFCFFNNVVVGAYHARAVHGMTRVAVIDIDVHHGNGSQAWAERDPDLFYASIHQDAIYPGTGHAHERGANGNVVNVTMPHAAGGAVWRERLEEEVFPALEAFGPDMIFISAGFDAHRDDPLAGMDLLESDFAWVTRRLDELAQQLCGGRLVSTLEGGYDLLALGRCAAAHVRALSGA